MGSQPYDVTILGGGLAGLSLARQLSQRRPGTSIAVLERHAFPRPAGACKVGESSVELGAHYFAEVLGLGQHIREHQLPKLGLRFFFDPGTGPFELRSELGLTRPYATPSYQLDRGTFENHLAEVVRGDGVDLREGCRVARHVALADGEDHRVTFTSDAGEEEIRTRWVVDASGRRGLLKRRLGLEETVDHRIHAAWFRLDASIRIDDWCRDEPDAAGAPVQRWLSTNHLMGAGYWVWLIPLAGGMTSVGIVADPRLHPLSGFNSYDKALAWLRRHEPECAERIAARVDGPLDFLAVKNIAYSAKQVFSADRWALTGEAGVFLDPFYSPGSDFIAIGNTLICALVERDLRGRPVGALARTYDDFYLGLFRNTLRVYENQYPLFGHAEVMSAKVLWDYAVYWTFPAFLFIQGRIERPSTLARIRPAAERIGELNARMQAFFRQWSRSQPSRPGAGFVDQSAIAPLARLNAGLTDELDDEAFHTRFLDNLAGLEELAAEVVARAAARQPALAAFGDGRPAAGTRLETLWRAFPVAAAADAL